MYMYAALLNRNFPNVTSLKTTLHLTTVEPLLKDTLK